MAFGKVQIKCRYFLTANFSPKDQVVGALRGTRSQVESFSSRSTCSQHILVFQRFQANCICTCLFCLSAHRHIEDAQVKTNHSLTVFLSMEQYSGSLDTRSLACLPSISSSKHGLSSILPIQPHKQTRSYFTASLPGIPGESTRCFCTNRSAHNARSARACLHAYRQDKTIFMQQTVDTYAITKIFPRKCMCFEFLYRAQCMYTAIK
jgi:hypothetical protein